ncbi:MAG: efflux RND transporter periplasmic adaptor subunit [Gammaproteobacteria bacterium]|nr:efflux RND transporter periplasmic adaptor subunit [Gammaproteobacteria bacterium]MDH5801849.1 efflux RND transporter periplasmic adaptor subunit [Gammaproteobacteria bacterium]
MTLKTLVIVVVLGMFQGAWAELPFATLSVDYRTVAQKSQVDAVVEAVKRSTVSAQTSGRIIEVNFDIGDFVKANSILVRISRTEQQPQLAAADALQQEALVRLNEAEIEQKRVQEVFDRKLVAKSAMDKANADVNAAQKRYEAAKAKARQARAKLTYTTVKAPYSGYVVKRFVDIGETVGPGKPIMSGLSLEQLRASAYIPQSLVSQVRTLKSAEVLVGERVLQSSEIQVSPQAEPDSHAYLLRVYLPERTRDLLPGMFVKLVLNTGERKVLLVPQTAVVRRSELTALYVVNGQQVSLRQVRVGRTHGDSVEVLAGLQAGENIALDPIAAGIQLKEATGPKAQEGKHE